MLTSNFQYGLEVALCLLLLFVFTLRFKVRPHASTLINVPVAKVWALLAPYDGKIDQWGNMQIVTTLISDETKSYAIQYATTQSNGNVRKFFAQFTLAQVEDNRLLLMKRDGLEGKSLNNELLEIRHEFEALGEATKLRTTYVWGPRPFLAQLLARTDLWGGIYRIKGLAETGKPNNRPYWIINGLVALVTALMSVVAFGLLLGWPSAKIFVAVGVLTSVLNAFNMLPAEPLDGGVALRSILTRLVGKSAWSAMLSIGLLMIATGIAIGQLAVAVFGVMAVLANLRRRSIDAGLLPLTSLQVCVAVLGYVAITSAHITMMNWFFRQLGV